MLNIFQEFPKFLRYFRELQQHIKRDYNTINFSQEQELFSIIFDILRTKVFHDSAS